MLRPEGTTLQERIAANRQRTLVLALTFGVLVTALFTVVLGLISRDLLSSLVASLVIAVAWVLVAWLRSDSTILDLTDAADADVLRDARLFNVVNGLRAAMGLPALDLYVVDDPALNALAVGRDPHHASLVVTRGLVDQAGLIELEAVVALQLYRIKTHETAPESFIVPTFGALGALAEATDRVEWLSRVLRLPTPWVDAIVERIHGIRDEIETDIEAMQFTRYPPGLASVLDKMAGRSAPAVAAPVTAHLWAAPPLAPSAHPTAARLHAPLPERVAVLQEL